MVGHPSSLSVRTASVIKRRSIAKLQTSSASKSTLSTSNRTRISQRQLDHPLPERPIGRATTFGSASVSRVVPNVSANSNMQKKPNVRSDILAPISQCRNRSTGLSTRQNMSTGRPPSGRLQSRSSTPSNGSSEMVMLKEKIKLLEDNATASKEISEMFKQQMEMLKSQVETGKMLLEASKTKLDFTETKLMASENLTKQKTEELDVCREELEEKDAQLRKLHNDVVDLRGQIRVSIRVRPLLPSEINNATTSIINYPARNCIAFEKNKFDFENVFTPVYTQNELFSHVEELILSCLHGFNVSLIAFGQTGSGKTYTMRGGLGEERGVIPRSVEYLFRQSEKLKNLDWSFEFMVSFIEIYNNETYDLLNKHHKLKIMLASNNVEIHGLTEHPVTCIADVTRLLHVADENRKTASTKCNSQSSRSHAIFQWAVKAKQEKTGITTTSILKIVDLAGSERAKESGVTGDRFQEMTHINMSLSCLQKCIALQKSKSTHVPYRDTKLTQCLKDCLGGGNSKTMVIVNINPCDDQVQESKRSCELAAKMRETKIGVAVQQRDAMNTTCR